MLFVTAFAINSCRKDVQKEMPSRSTVALTKNGFDINKLKTAYNNGINLKKLKIADISQQTFANIIGSLTVDWTSYTLTTYPDSTQIIEFAMPDDSTLVVPGSLTLHDTLKYHPKTSAVFIMRKDTINMSFFMKTIEDCTAPGYQSVIGSVLYNQEPSTFNGNVFYFTLARQYINGYHWLNGTPDKTLSLSSTAGSGPQNNLNGKKKVNTTSVPLCATEVYGVYNVTEDSSGNITSWQNQVGTIYVTSCTSVDLGGGGGDAGGGTSGGTTGGGGGVNGAPPQPLCPTNSALTYVKGHLKVDVVQNPPGSGSPGTTTSPCAVIVSSTPIYGINNSNAIISDANFDSYLAYVQTVGYTFSDPFNTTVVINGVSYAGQVTEVYNTAGQLVASYFSPNATSGPFQIGMEYNIGNSNVGTSNTAPTAPITIFGSSTANIGTNAATYSVPAGKGGAHITGTAPLVEDPTNVDWSNEPDNVVLTDPNPAIPAQYQPTSPWPTIANIVPFSQFVPFRKVSINGVLVGVNCLTLSKEQIAKLGYTCSGYLPGSQTFQIYTSANVVDQTVTKQAITYMISALSSHIPIIAGVDVYPGYSNKGDKITDHFITIDGMGTDRNGAKFFHFVDNSTAYAGQGDYYDNKLYYNTTTGLITGISASGYATKSPSSHPYIVTQIRKSIPLK